jgi:radical SAM protein with 4Fe4S-binding SPASM domain
MNHNDEPLLAHDLAWAIRYAKFRGVLNVYVATNGTKLDRETAAGLIDAGLSKVMISLDAASAATYRKMRNSDLFDTVIRNINGLLELREELGVSWPLVRVNFLRTDLNAGDAEPFLEYWKDRADMIGFQDLLGIPGVTAGGAPDLSKVHCSFPYKQIVVAANGDLLPCCTFSGNDLPLGNIYRRKDSITKAWTSPWMDTLRRIHYAGRADLCHTCAHCLGGEDA